MTENRLYKVLVLMSTYNGEKYLAEQLDSIKKQEAVCVSVMIRDDGSTDNTVNIISQYAKDMDIKLYTGDNLRPAKSFWNLVQEASLEYDYYAFSDQDDYWEADKLRIAIDKLEMLNVEKPAMYYSGQKLVDSQLNEIGNHVLDNCRSRYANYVFNQVAGCTVVFNKKLLEYAKLSKDINLHMHDSYLYRLCAALDGEFIIEPQGHILYRQHLNNEVGLQYSLKGKLGLFKEHLYSQAPRNDAKTIMNIYEQYISKEWKCFLQDIINVDKSFKIKRRMLCSKLMKFNSLKIRATYIIKVLFSKF